MDFERIKQNLRFRSGRSNDSKNKSSTGSSTRFPNREPQGPPPQDPLPAIGEVPVINKSVRRKLLNKSMGSSSGKGKAALPKAENIDASSAKKETPVTLPPLASTSAQNAQDEVYVQSSLDFAQNEVPNPASDSEGAGFDLAPPPPKNPNKSMSIETLSELLYSQGYLNILTDQPQLLSRFTAFLHKYKPELVYVVAQYLEIQKAVKAIQYANAVASGMDESGVVTAANLSPEFKTMFDGIFVKLHEEALPAWVTYSLVKTATFCLTTEITGQSNPLTRELVGGLSEVFCITDPNREDNPIVFATEEFYRLTGYGTESVIGHNCRFLQGPRTQKASVQRLKAAIAKGEEVCETLLNFRRDGRPFINVLLIAPLLDDKGQVKYFLGAQVDASRLVVSGLGVDGFESFLLKREMAAKREEGPKIDGKQLALEKLRDLSLSFDLEESTIVRSNSRSGSRRGSMDSREGSKQGQRRLRLNDVDEEEGEQAGDDDWKLSEDMNSGKLPGIYKKYLLIRPYPSLRTIFASASARKLGQLQQRPFLQSVAASSRTLKGLKEAFAAGEGLTAKIALLEKPGKDREGTVTGGWGSLKDKFKGAEPEGNSTTCWISATPLLDATNKPGVWMVVIVDKASIAANTGRPAGAAAGLLAGPGRAAAPVDEDAVGQAINQKSRGELPGKPRAVNILDEESRSARSSRATSRGLGAGVASVSSATTPGSVKSLARQAGSGLESGGGGRGGMAGRVEADGKGDGEDDGEDDGEGDGDAEGTSPSEEEETAREEVAKEVRLRRDLQQEVVGDRGGERSEVVAAKAEAEVEAETGRRESVVVVPEMGLRDFLVERGRRRERAGGEEEEVLGGSSGVD